MEASLHRVLSALAAVSLLSVAAPALAQSETDLPDDIFGDDDLTTASPTVAQEREQLLSDAATEEIQLPEADKKKRVIQTLQRKSFMKIGRYEGGVGVGFVTNDPFVNRYLLGGHFAYHVTEIFAVEAEGAFSPDFGEGDWKPITDQIINNNEVTPDISKIQFYANANFQFSPIYGKVAVGQGRIVNFDIFGLFGSGIVNTADQIDLIEEDQNEAAIATESQIHPTLNYGVGTRIIFSEAFAFRFEGRGLSYIEVIESTTLEMKNNFTIMASASFFFPGMK